MYASANDGRKTLLELSNVPEQSMPNVNQRGGVFGPQGYGGGIFDGMSGVGLPVGQNSDEPKYPWGQYAQSTQSLQFATNVELRMRDMPEIGTDGILGPETCGAQKYLHETEGIAEHEPPATCQSFQYPRQDSAPSDSMPRAEAPAVDEPAETSRAGMGTWGFILIAGGVAAAGIYLATRKKR